MGQSVSVDGRLWELRELLRLVDLESRPEPGSPHQSPKRAPVKHHVKAWQFTENGRAVVDSPLALCNQQGILDVDIQRCCSYLLLHVWAPSSTGEDQGGPATSLLEDLEAKAGATFTPRGLAASPIVNSGSRDGSGQALRHSIFVWHGLDVSQHVRARAFARAFELDIAISNGLLRQLSFAESLADATALRNLPSGPLQSPAWCSSPKEGKAGEAATATGHHNNCGSNTSNHSNGNSNGHNQLLQAILRGVPSATGCGRRGVPRPTAGTGLRRFPHVGQRLLRDLGHTHSGSPGHSPAFSQGRQPDPSPSPIGPAGPAAVPRLALGPCGAQPSAAAGPVPVPALAPNGAAMEASSDAAAFVSMDSEQSQSQLQSQSHQQQQAQPRSLEEALQMHVDQDSGAGLGMARDSLPSQDTDGMRKRLRGGNKGAYAGRSPGLAGVLAAKSTRLGESHGVQSPQKELGLPRGGVVPALNLASAQTVAGSQRTTIADRPDAPAMLNLEEVNMSEEDLIRSYDPHNEENNYHLPDHLYKALQLKHYRQACSEVVANAVYLGGYQVAGDLECLQRHGITHIVNMAADVCDSSFPEHFSYLTYYLKDTNSEEISPLFYRTLDWIQKAVDSDGRVLVHCREGVSRSATMVIAYLMWRLGLSFEAAHEKLQKARPICNPNTGFTCQLLMLGKRLGITGRQGPGAGGPCPPPGGQGQSQSPPGCGQSALGLALERPQLFRVVPHHPKEPFLLLAPAEWPRSWPSLDPRFGWVLQRAGQLLLWLGARVPNPEAVQEAVQQHARWVEAFEHRSLAVSSTSQGAESPAFLQALATSQGESPEVSEVGLDPESPNPAFDADFEILCSLRGRGQGQTAPAPEDLLTSSSPPTTYRRNSDLCTGRANGPYHRPL